MLGEDTTRWRRESASRFVAAVAINDAEDGATIYGLARSTVIENKLGFGQSSYLQHEEVWFDSIEQLADALALQAGDSVGVRLGAEAGAKPWVDVVLLLTNQNDEIDLPPNWTYHLQVVAGLYAVNLSVHRSAGAATRHLIKEIQVSAPDGLLVSGKSVPGADMFLSLFAKARQGGYAAVLGGATAADFSEYILELGWHLREFRAARQSEPVSEDASWKEVAPLVRALESAHFILTDTARESLDQNPYPKPKRMLDHLQALESLAKEHFEASGEMAGRLSDAAAVHGIEIALFDDAMPPTFVDHCGRKHSTKPHVKVDDYKSPADCGRIYFAVDSVCGAFIVDHVGLHNYY